MKLRQLLILGVIVSATVASNFGCGSSSPTPTLADKQQEEAYYQALEEAARRGIDPSTVPVPERSL